MKRSSSSLAVVCLVLLQAGLAVGHCHEVDCDSPNEGTRHVHVNEILEWGSHDSSHEESPCHDVWTVPASEPMALDAGPQSPGPAASVLALLPPPVSLNELTHASPQPLGLPPPKAGPDRPLFLTYCTLRN